MTSFEISNSTLDGIKDKVVVITGASSGIGLATLRRVCSHGGIVVAGDVNPLPEPEARSVTFHRVDVTSWEDQVRFFKAAHTEHGRIDHVFANAGVPMTISLLEDDVDDHGDPLPPNLRTLDINLTGCLYTVKLALHHMRKNPSSLTGSSIVVTASASSFSRFPATDYTTAKHGVLGLMRSLYPHLHPKLPIRINAISPSWTDTGMVPPAILSALGSENYQSADAVARSVVLLMADTARHGNLIYSERGQYRELENGPQGMHTAIAGVLGVAREEDLPELKVFRALAEKGNSIL